MLVYPRGRGFLIFLYFGRSFYLHTIRLHSLFAARLKVRLLDLGQSEAIAAKVTQSFMAALHPHAIDTFNLDSAVQTEKIAEIVALEITRGYNSAPTLSLPSKPPERWLGRSRPNKSETCIAFMRRVWGPYIDAGILYQADLRRYGERVLMDTVRSYCIYHGLDITKYLPPSTDDIVPNILATAEPGSRQEVYAKNAMQARERKAAVRRREKIQNLQVKKPQ